MLKVGITGGIGSGKSFVCEVFSHLGIPIYGADQEAKRLMNTNQYIRDQLIIYFGAETYTPEGSLNRDFLSRVVFNRPDLLKRLNNIVHPEVRKDFEQWAQQQNSAYVLEEAAILFESGGSRFVDLTITVTAPIELRIKRVMQRDSCTRQQVLDRMKNQWTDEEKISRSDFVITTNNEAELLVPQIVNIDKEIRLYGKIR